MVPPYDITNPSILRTLSITLLTLLLTSQLTQSTRILPVKDPNNILVTFGSCNGFQNNTNDDIFYKIAEMNPDVWLWLGDVAYLDDPHPLPPVLNDTSIQYIIEKFNASKTSPAYVNLRKNVSVIGTWDDHDFGHDNAGKSFPHKDITKKFWLDFMDEPLDSPRRQRGGVYESYYIGDPTKIKVIVFDVRYFMDDADAFDKREMLGEEQWKWLEAELAGNKAQYVILASGLQVLPDDRIAGERWSLRSRDRLLGLLRKYKVGGSVILSGDVHYAEIMKHPCKERLGYELYEFTSSGLTHHLNGHMMFADDFVESMMPETYNTKEDRYMRENYGVVRFKFGEGAGVRMEARDSNGKLVLEQDIDYRDMKFDEGILDDGSSCVMDRNFYVRFAENHVKALFTWRWYPYALLMVVGGPILCVLLLLKCLCKRVVSRGHRYSNLKKEKVKDI